MNNKQLFAKIGIFVLLGLNVAAYYFFWPNYQGSPNESKAATQEKGESRLLPDPKDARPASPKALPAAPIEEAKPLNEPSVPQDKMPTPEAELLSKLLERIEQEKKQPAPLDVVPKDPVKKEETPKILPPLPADPLAGAVPPPPVLLPKEKADVAPVAIASPLSPKVAPSPWQLSMEVVGNRTHLFAKLRQSNLLAPAVEFKIACERVEMKAPGGEVQALGKVTFQGAGITGACQRLTLPIHDARLVFEEQVQLQHDAAPAPAILRGDRITWEPPAQPR